MQTKLITAFWYVLHTGQEIKAEILPYKISLEIRWSKFQKTEITTRLQYVGKFHFEQYLQEILLWKYCAEQSVLIKKQGLLKNLIYTFFYFYYSDNKVCAPIFSVEKW